MIDRLVGGERAWAALLSALKGAARLPHSQLSYDDDERLVKNGFLLRPSAGQCVKRPPGGRNGDGSLRFVNFAPNIVTSCGCRCR